MQTDLDVLIEIPCFKCLFWDRRRQSRPYCNPNECRKLTEWLFKQIEKDSPTEEALTFTIAQQIKSKEKTKP